MSQAELIAGFSDLGQEWAIKLRIEQLAVQWCKGEELWRFIEEKVALGSEVAINHKLLHLFGQEREKFIESQVALRSEVAIDAKIARPHRI